ncbi:MAG TPA: hypothetical protein VHK67_00145 [Rhabdochlamydiaceae bacterium]|jgi:hypothetical protein|nr:hypothetical protein [Rhabdochlamydiaceae bacterium]
MTNRERQAKLRQQEETLDDLLTQVQGQKKAAENLAVHVSSKPLPPSSTQPAPTKNKGISFGDAIVGVFTTIVGPSPTKDLSNRPPDWINPNQKDSLAMKLQRAYFASLWKWLKGDVFDRLSHMTSYETQDELLKKGQYKVILEAPWEKFAEEARAILNANS